MNSSNMKRFLEIAASIGGIVVEYKGEYKHFKTSEELVRWAKRINVYEFVPYNDPKDGKVKLIQNLEGVNIVAYCDKSPSITP